MRRRRLIAIVSVCTLLGIGLIAVVGSWALMRTDVPRRFLQRLIASGVNGSVYLGRVSGNPFTGVTVDSFAIRDRSGELFVSTGKVAFDYDIRDVMDTRIYLRHVVADHPYVHLRQFQNEDWNFRRIFRRGPSKPKPASSPGRSWLDFMVFDSVRAINGSFILSLRWSPDANLTGKALDSALSYELTRKDHNITRTADGFSRNYSWTRGTTLLTHVRLADPDSDRLGKQINIASLEVDESDPPFNFKYVRGDVRVLGDSVWLNLAHWDLPASSGSAKGKIFWGSDLPIRYDITVPADSVAFNDISWIYPTLPKTGGGKVIIHIGNKRDLSVMDYQLTHMDVRTTGSHVTGAMTFGVGQPVLQVRNVDLNADPLDFKFIHTLAGKPLPIDWQGQIYGSVRAAGGPLTEFQVDAAHGEWRDSHVPGAVSRLSGTGGLDILDPQFTAFHGFHVDVGTLDLRSIEYLFPAFPRLRGSIAGTATLDSIWTDVRFKNADITHRDGAGKPSRFTGSGRITDGDKFIAYDVGLIADSLNFSMLAQSYPSLGLRGMVAGPIRITGTTPDLSIDARLSGPAGQFAFDGRVDIDSVGGYFARGRGTFANVNLAQLLANESAPFSSLTGKYDLDVSGAGASSLSGIAGLKLDQSRLDSARFEASNATIRFTNGRAILTDTVVAQGPIGRAKAYGSIGLPGGSSSDSIHVVLSVDSIGALRPFIGSAGSRPDSLTGNIDVRGVAVGRLDSLLVSGDIAGSNLFVRGVEAPSLAGTFTIFDALRAPHGDVTAAGNDVRVGGLRFDTLRFDLGISDTTRGSYALRGATSTGRMADSVQLAAGGRWSRLGGLTTVRVDSLQLRTGESRWALDRTATISMDSTMFAVDTAAFTNGKDAWIGIAGVRPDTGAVNFRVNAKAVPLADLNRWLFPRTTAMTGSVNLSALFGGTLADLRVDASALFDSIKVGGVQIGKLKSSGHYQNRQAAVSLNITENDSTVVLEANADSLPLKMTMFGYDTIPGRLHATISADSADFTIMQTFMTGVSDVKGKMSGSMTLEGTWSQPMLSGIFALRNGSMTIDTLGISVVNVNGNARYANDVLSIDSLDAQSKGNKGGSAQISGPIAFKGWRPDSFNLKMTMSSFEIYNRSELARVIATTNRDSGAVRLFGTMARDTVRGWVSIDKSDIFLPDPKISAKQIKEDVAGPSLDLTAAADTSLLDRVTANLQTDLRVHIGNDVKLSADYADIPLAGDLRIMPITVFSATANKGAGAFINRLAPEGTISADAGGNYTLFPDVPLLTRKLAVEKGGTITFDRDADWNPLLNLTARYNVKSAGHADIPVIVDVRGRLLPRPELAFRTDAPFPIGESDLISYLVTGAPGFDLAAQSNDVKNLVASVLVPTLNSTVSNALRDKLGSGIRLGLESASPDLAAGATGTKGGGFTSLISSTRLTGDFQLTDKMYLSVSTGLCQASQDYRNGSNSTTLAQLANPFAGSLEYRLSSKLKSGQSLSVSSEPSTQALLCSSSSDVALRGVAPTTTRQMSFSWLNYWRW